MLHQVVMKTRCPALECTYNKERGSSLFGNGDQRSSHNVVDHDSGLRPVLFLLSETTDLAVSRAWARANPDLSLTVRAPGGPGRGNVRLGLENWGCRRPFSRAQEVHLEGDA